MATNPELAELLASVKKLRKALAKLYGPVIEEMFAEMGKKRAGNWGIINDGLLEAQTALKETKRYS
jgi:1-aminocyclopropane-1-carboxylate deaminase/D-cysteine desulfhydrase-like pyridoxal-dependent ACC family enzyme